MEENAVVSSSEQVSDEELIAWFRHPNKEFANRISQCAENLKKCNERLEHCSQLCDNILKRLNEHS